MKCNTCNAQWDTPANAGTTQKFCPFCGATLEESTQHKPNSLFGVLSAMYDQYGIELLSDSHRLLAYFVDLAPQLKKEKQLLQHFLSCEGNTKLINALKLPETDQRKTVNQLLLHMTDVMFISEKVSSLVIDSFWQAIGGKSYFENSAGQLSAEVTPSYTSGLSQENDEELRKLAEEGVVAAQIQLANLLNRTENSTKQKNEAVAWYTKAADQGAPAAMYELAVLLLDGKLVSNDEARAVKLLKNAAECGYPEAQYLYGQKCKSGIKDILARDDAQYLYWLGRAADSSNRIVAAEANLYLAISYELGDKVAQDYKKAFSLYRDSAEYGSIGGLMNLARCYKDGIGVEKNPSIAYQLICKSAQSENATSHAYFSLGMFLENGIGTTPDFDEALKWYRRAAEGDSLDAKNAIGRFYEHGISVEQDLSEAIKWYIRAAEEGSLSAIKNLAKRYENGDGVPYDKNEATKWYLKGADRDDAFCIFKVGENMMAYDSLIKNDREGARWIAIAANRGCEEAQVALADLYKWGLEVPEDREKAFLWLKKAEKTHNPDVMYEIAESYKELDMAQSLTWYRRAAEAGNALASFTLGNSYLSGKFTPVDLSAAFNWFSLAVEQGHGKAKYCLGVCYEKGLGTLVDKEKAFQLYMSTAGRVEDFDRGGAESCCKVALCLEDGISTQTDPVVTKGWHAKALHMARIFEDMPEYHPFIQYYLGRCYSEGFGVGKDLDTATKYMETAHKYGEDLATKWLEHQKKSSKPKWMFWK